MIWTIPVLNFLKMTKTFKTNKKNFKGHFFVCLRCKFHFCSWLETNSKAVYYI